MVGIMVILHALGENLYNIYPPVIRSSWFISICPVVLYCLEDLFSFIGLLFKVFPYILCCCPLIVQSDASNYAIRMYLFILYIYSRIHLRFSSMDISRRISFQLQMYRVRQWYLIYMFCIE